MSPTDTHGAKDGFLTQADRKKRLGQYFTGEGLGRVLAALARAETAASIIDPMEGSGDLLQSCLALAAKPKVLAGVEIDSTANASAKERIPEAVHILGNIFDESLIANLPLAEWDLVIANPPYVRYQSMASAAGRRLWLPSAVEIRTGLLATISQLSSLDDEDKRLFTKLASGYSGLADLAVPSWILCAGLVSMGGRLALVVPESWLSRDYATVVHYLLLRWFQVECIIEDEHAAWFGDAQVKTTLLVARRIPRRESAFDWKDELYARARVSGSAAGADGPIARLYPGSQTPEMAFAGSVRDVASCGKSYRDSLHNIASAPIAGMARALRSSARKQRWLSEMGEATTADPLGVELPQPLSEWVDSCKGLSTFIPLEETGVIVGQGLRTGANGFFYATLVSNVGRKAVIQPDGVPGIGTTAVPNACLIPTLRRQSELPAGFVVRKRDLDGRTLDLRSVALPEDIKAGGALARRQYRPMAKELAAFVRHAGAANFGTEATPRRIQELSAVAPNIRKGDGITGTPPRYWYMLPDFAPRHLPLLVVPRINSGTVKTFLVAGKGILVDANFATINIAPQHHLTAHATLALLNSSWCAAAFEYGSSVMGGGALKVEATHLRRLPVPRLTPSLCKRLDALGKMLAERRSVRLSINRLIISAVLGRPPSLNEIASLERLGEDGWARRNLHKKKGNRRVDSF